MSPTTKPLLEASLSAFPFCVPVSLSPNPSSVVQAHHVPVRPLFRPPFSLPSKKRHTATLFIRAKLSLPACHPKGKLLKRESAHHGRMLFMLSSTPPSVLNFPSLSLSSSLLSISEFSSFPRSLFLDFFCFFFHFTFALSSNLQT